MRDNWCVGFSRRYTVGVWVGNFSGEPMRDVSGVTGAAPVWLEMMDWLHRASPSEPPAPPAGVVATTVSFPGDVEPPRREWTLAGTEDPARRRSPSGRAAHPHAGRRARASRSIPTCRRSASACGWRPRGPPRDCAGAWTAETSGPRTRRACGAPMPGAHVLELVDEAGAVRDRVEFEVRGVAGGAGAPSHTDVN